MELVYLWIEDYKNIKKQGFNFSPRFDVKYDEEKNELTIDKKEYNPIFPNNINVTAIIGENGSGKSSLLFQELNGNTGMSPELRVIFKNNILEIHEPYKSHGDEDGPCVYICKLQNKTVYEVKKKTIHNNINTEDFEKQYLSEAKSQLLSKPYSLHFNWDVLNYVDYENFTQQGMYDTVKKKPNILIPLITNDNDTIDYTMFYQKIMKKILQNYNSTLYNYLLFKPSIVSVDYSSLENPSKDFIKTLTENNISSSGQFFIIQIEKLVKNINKNIEEFYSLLDSSKIILNIQDENNRELFDLSHGERSLFILLFLIYSEATNRNMDLIIYLDEPDLTIHPNWQKVLISNLIHLFTNFKHKVHFILTSHSPFLISDLPKENITFLEKGKQVYPDIETFGANIHTLLSHGFFMKDGLMGEFAKGKIDKAIKYLNQTVLSSDEIDFCENIISITGEPILKRQMQKMLDSKRLSKVDKIDKLEADIKFMQEKIKKLENSDTDNR